NNIAGSLWVDGHLNRQVIAQDAAVAARVFGLGDQAARSSFFMVEEDAVGGKNSFADEKLSLVLTVYRARSFDEAKRIVRDILEVNGRGHSVGIHTRDMERARDLASHVAVVRVLVNHAHTFGNGGGFDNALPFTL